MLHSFVNTRPSEMRMESKSRNHTAIEDDEEVAVCTSGTTEARRRRGRQCNVVDASDKIYNNGPWSKKERILFLKGLKKYGKGKWKKISTVVNTRSIRQVKSHGQKIFWKVEDGIDIFAELDESFQEVKDCSVSGQLNKATSCFEISESPRSQAQSHSPYVADEAWYDDTNDTIVIASTISVGRSVPEDIYRRPCKLSTTSEDNSCTDHPSCALSRTSTFPTFSSGKDRISSPRLLSPAKPYRSGKWSKKEKTLFLKGLKKFGKGKWKKISTVVRTRSVLQVKSHGQKVFTKIQEGRDVFAELDQSNLGCTEESQENVHCSESQKRCSGLASKACMKKDSATCTNANLHEDNCNDENIENHNISCSRPIRKVGNKRPITSILPRCSHNLSCTANVNRKCPSSKYERFEMDTSKETSRNDKDRIAALALCELSIPGVTRMFK